jgi:CO/xanthine dehydrogenase Mo-binding subunit
MATAIFSRRGLFQVVGGALIVRFAFGQTRSLDPAEVDSFLAIHSDGSVTIYTSKVDVGTGLATAFRQTAAEELGIPVDRFSVIAGDTALTPDHGGTGGSSGIPRGAADIRRAAATARQGLLDLASKRFNRPASEFTITNGAVVNPNGSSATIASLIGDKQFGLKLDAKAPLKNPQAYTVVGKSLLRPEVTAKVTGKHPWLQDFTLHGMLHGRVVRPPAIGAKLLSVDEASIRTIPDVRVVQIESFVGVVAKDEWAAVRAAREIKATWSDWQGLPGSEGLAQFVRNAPVEKNQTVATKGDVEARLAAVPQQLSATYYWPFQSHASLSPSCAVADVKDSGTTVWSATQNPYGLRANLAKVFNIPLEKVRLVYMDGSGSYGTNGADDAAADAIMLSRVVGAPVRVQWMRADEHGWDPKGPAQLHEMRGAVDANGNISAWETQMWVPDGPGGSRALLGPESAGMQQTHGQGAGLMTLNLDPPYPVANMRIVSHHLKDTPLRLSNLRAPGKIANVFAVESFADELAHAAGMDPVAFRTRGLADQRALDVLNRTAGLMDWQPRKSPNPNAAEGDLAIGRGIAYVRYKQAENYVAIGVTLAVNKNTGAITVRRVVCAHDCGLVVNPDGLRNQVEGNIVQTLSRTLHEEVTFDRSRVTSTDWVRYPLLRFPEAPVVQVALIDRPTEPSYGAGEAAAAPVAAAVANAVFDATGVRLRTIPFTAARVKAALSKA